SCTTSIPCRSARSQNAGSGNTSARALRRSQSSREAWRRRAMDKSSFVYVTYIRTTPDKLWEALIEPEFTRQFWAGTWQVSEGTVGSSWQIRIPDGRIADSGEVLEIEPNRRLVLSWRNEFRPELQPEGYSRLTYLLEQQGDMVKLTVTHEMARRGSKL